MKEQAERTFGLVDFAIVIACGLAGLVVTVVAMGVLPLMNVTIGAHTAWYGARAAGMLAWVLSTLSVAFGIAISSKAGKFLGKANVAETHRVLSLLSLFAIGAHTLFLALDQYANFGVRDLALPFATWYRPFWTGPGIIAAYLTAAVYASFYLRSFIGYKAWRAFHFLSFAVFVMGTLHGIFAGADTGETWALALYGSGTALVLGLLGYRIAQVRKAQAGRQVPGLRMLNASPNEA